MDQDHNGTRPIICPPGIPEASTAVFDHQGWRCGLAFDILWTFVSFLFFNTQAFIRWKVAAAQQLVLQPVATAQCSSDADEKRIRDAIKGQEQEIEMSVKTVHDTGGSTPVSRMIAKHGDLPDLEVSTQHTVAGVVLRITLGTCTWMMLPFVLASNPLTIKDYILMGSGAVIILVKICCFICLFKRWPMVIALGAVASPVFGSNTLVGAVCLCCFHQRSLATYLYLFFFGPVESVCIISKKLRMNATFDRCSLHRLRDSEGGVKLI